jgi:hypothetical protein
MRMFESEDAITPPGSPGGSSGGSSGGCAPLPSGSTTGTPFKSPLMKHSQAATHPRTPLCSTYSQPAEALRPSTGTVVLAGMLPTDW